MKLDPDKYVVIGEWQENGTDGPWKWDLISGPDRVWTWDEAKEIRRALRENPDVKNWELPHREKIISYAKFLEIPED